MKFSVVTVLALAGAHVSSATRGTKRQTGPVDSSTNPYCTYYDTVFSKNDNCAYFEDFWSISHDDFVLWVSLCHFHALRSYVINAHQLCPEPVRQE